MIGITGYLSFLDQTPQDLLLNYSISDVIMNFGRLLLTFTMLIALPLNLNPTIRSGLQLRQYLRGTESSQDSDATRMVLTLACLACQVVLAILVPGVADVLSLLGATVATATMLTIPAYAMGVILPRTPENRLKQAILILFSLVSVAAVPIKLCRLCGLMGQ